MLRQFGTLVCSMFLIVVFSLSLASCGGGGSMGNSNTGGTDVCNEGFNDPECHTLVFDGVTRAYLLHVPANFQPGSSALVIGLHGSGGSGARFQNTSQLSLKADQVGFAIAYPYALLSPGAGITEWNEFFNNSFGPNPPDDVGFLRQLITNLQSTLNPNPKKIFVAGLSNGGFMAHRVGVQISDLVAAIGVVEGTVVSPGNIQNVPNPLSPVSVLALHGDMDPVVLYCGTPVVASQEQTFNYWSGVGANNCSSLDTNLPLCDVQRNITAVLEKDATNCAGNSEVKFYKLEGGVHQWYLTPMNVAGQVPFNPDFNTSTGITTDDILWNFFSSHAKP